MHKLFVATSIIVFIDSFNQCHQNQHIQLDAGDNGFISFSLFWFFYLYMYMKVFLWLSLNPRFTALFFNIILIFDQNVHNSFSLYESVFMCYTYSFYIIPIPVKLQHIHIVMAICKHKVWFCCTLSSTHTHIHTYLQILIETFIVVE